MGELWGHRNYENLNYGDNSGDKFWANSANSANSGQILGTANSGDTLLIYGLWSRLFGFERSIEQPFQPVNEGIIAYWPPGSLMLSEKIHLRFLNANG